MINNGTISFSKYFSDLIFADFIIGGVTENGEEFYHTRIGNKDLKINGGIYNIRDLNSFRQNYYQHVFVNGNKEWVK